MKTGEGREKYVKLHKKETFSPSEDKNNVNMFTYGAVKTNKFKYYTKVSWVNTKCSLTMKILQKLSKPSHYNCNQAFAITGNEFVSLF